MARRSKSTSEAKTKTSKKAPAKKSAERTNSKRPKASPSTPKAKSSGYAAKDITVLEGLDPVRKRPGMYIGSTGIKGLHELVREVVDNSVDEAMAGHCDHIDVTLLPDGGCRVTDNGRGIPVDSHPRFRSKSAAEVVMTTLHAGGKFGGGGYKVSGGLHGVGVSVVNALSTRLELEIDSSNDAKRYRMSFHNGGKVKTKLKPVGKAPRGRTGTSVTFWPDPEIFSSEGIEFRAQTILERLQTYAFLNKSLEIRFRDERKDKEQEQTFRYTGGIVDFVKYLNHAKEALFKRVAGYEMKEPDQEVEVALQWNTGYNEGIHSFANGIETAEGGMHEEGFKKALTNVVNRYAREKNVVKEKDENLLGEDIREGLTAVVSVRLAEPQFEGQTKGKLGNVSARSLLERATNERLASWLEENPAEARKVVQKSIAAARARRAAKEARDLTRRKSALEGAGMPDKLRDCASGTPPEEAELFIIEGDSAGGTAVQAREPHNQAILPIRGKFLNVEKARIDKMMKNAEVQTLIAAVGGGVGNEDFEISKARYHKVVIMSVEGGESVLLTDATGRLRIRSIGEAVDAWLDEGQEVPDAATVSADVEDPHMRLSPLKRVIRHPFNGHMHRIKTAYGREINVTAGHSVFTWERGRMTLRPADELRPGDLLVAPRRLPRPTESVVEIDLLELFVRSGLGRGLRVEGESIRELAARDQGRTLPRSKRGDEERVDTRSRRLDEVRIEDLHVVASDVQLVPQAHKDDGFSRMLPVTTELCYFLGWFAAEGSLSRMNQVSLSLGEDDDAYIPSIMEAIETAFGRQAGVHRPKNRPKSRKLYFHSPMAARLLTALGLGTRAISKRVPDLLLNLDREHQLAFLEGYFLGDGSKGRVKNRLALCTASRDLADGLLYLLGQLGVVASCSWNDGSSNVLSERGSYQITISGKDQLLELESVWRKAPNAPLLRDHATSEKNRKRPMWIEISDDLMAVPIRSNVAFPYAGEVYDLSVAEDENFIAGFGGGLLAHNTDADIDGSHIRTLLLTFFFRHMKPLIEAGYVYIAQPPLFSTLVGKERVYLKDEQARSKFLEQKDDHKSDFVRLKGLGEMDYGELWETTMDPGRRTLLQVTIEQAAQADEIFGVLMGDNVEARKEFIVKNAKDVRFLDA